MTTLKIQSNSTGSGSVTLAAPVTSALRTQTLPDFDGTLVVAPSAGTAGQVLTSGGAGSAPYWSTASGEVTLSGAQTLTNKDLSSATNTFPSSLVTLTGTQTLSNKTLTAPTVNGIATLNGHTRIGVTVAQAAPSATDIASTAAGVLAPYGGNGIWFGQFPTTNGSWLQASFNNPTTAKYSIHIQPLGGDVGIGHSNAPKAQLDIWKSLSGGAPLTSGSSADPNAVLRIGGGGATADFGVYASGTIWLQPRLINDYAGNLNLMLNPNGGSVVVGNSLTFSGLISNGNSGTAVTVDFINGQKRSLGLTGNTTITLSCPGTGSYQLVLVQDATGGRTVTWGGGTVLYVGSATAPAINTAANGYTVVTIFCSSAGVFFLAASKVNAT